MAITNISRTRRGNVSTGRQELPRPHAGPVSPGLLEGALSPERRVENPPAKDTLGSSSSMTPVSTMTTSLPEGLSLVSLYLSGFPGPLSSFSESGPFEVFPDDPYPHPQIRRTDG